MKTICKGICWSKMGKQIFIIFLFFSDRLWQQRRPRRRQHPVTCSQPQRLQKSPFWRRPRTKRRESPPSASELFCLLAASKTRTFRLPRGPSGQSLETTVTEEEGCCTKTEAASRKHLQTRPRSWQGLQAREDRKTYSRGPDNISKKFSILSRGMQKNGPRNLIWDQI